MTDPTRLRIEAIAERHAKATPGEWHAGHLADDNHPCSCDSVVSDNGLMGGICRVSYDNGLSISEGGNDCPPLEEAKSNLLFIAHAHQDIPFLLADRTRLETENARLLAEITQARVLMGETAKYIEEMSVREVGNALESMTVCDMLIRKSPMTTKSSRRQITTAIRTLAEPHFYNSGFNKHLDPTKGMFGPKRPLRVFSTKKVQKFKGFVLTDMLALSEDGPITDGVGGGCVVTGFDDLPIEDLNLLLKWASRTFTKPESTAGGSRG